MKVLLQRVQRICQARSWKDLRRLIKLNIYSSKRFLRLMKHAAESMTGKQVEIYLQHPAVKTFSGHTYRKSLSVIAIDIKPGLDLENFYLTWLHELGHIILGHADNLPIRNDALLPEDMKTDLRGGKYWELSLQEQDDYDNSPLEADARALARELDHFAMNQAWVWGGDNTSNYKARIRALTKFKFQL
jgi:hypothetical protein